MRKADYALLAKIIRTMRLFHKNNNPSKCAALQSLAREFAERASVDKAAFFKACGLTESGDDFGV
jgi:hypothetical protein